MPPHYQVTVWSQAHIPHPVLLPVTEMGWVELDRALVPLLLYLPPIPKACKDITTCACLKECLIQLSICKKWHGVMQLLQIQ